MRRGRSSRELTQFAVLALVTVFDTVERCCSLAYALRSCDLRNPQRFGYVDLLVFLDSNEFGLLRMDATGPADISQLTTYGPEFYVQGFDGFFADYNRDGWDDIFFAEQYDVDFSNLSRQINDQHSGFLQDSHYINLSICFGGFGFTFEDLPFQAGT